MNQSERRRFLIDALTKENPNAWDGPVPRDERGQKLLLRGLFNIRPPRAMEQDALRVQDEYLQAELAARGVTDVETLPFVESKISLWQGDITTLKCDAIVNAANSGMTGCYCPNHGCIDNAIHTYAGAQLRLACAERMEKQGFPEPTGRAKITPAFNLPCRYVLHTVGPIVRGRVTDRDRSELADCYRSCLLLAAENGLSSVAFCCVSTREFHFPNREAAEIAVRTVREFLTNETSVRRVIFNVFKDEDRKIYERILGDGTSARGAR